MGLSNLSVKMRLFMTLSVMAAALLIVGLLGLRALKASNADLDGVYANNLMATVYIYEMISSSRDNVIALDETLMTGTAQSLAEFKRLVDENFRINDELWAKYQATHMAPGEEALAQAYVVKRQQYRDARNAVIDDLNAGRIEQARTRRTAELQPRVVAMVAAATQLLDLQQQVAHAANEDAESNYQSASIVSWIAIALGCGLGGLLGWMLVNSMLAALNTAVDASERIAQGELGLNIDASSRDEFGRLLTALRNMDTKLSEIVGSVRSGADEVGTAARQLSNGNDDLSQRTQEQASALEETASSMEEMTATVKQNADNARQASQLASGAREQADHGGAVVSRAVNAMGEINESSRRIADIINVIDEIAFQTNLLALNAAVEAARAGEQGRGFAVVATEVRNLAQRSASAAKEIKDLINDSVTKVQAGAQLVDESGKSLGEIVGSVKKVADIVAEISAASEEQAAGIDQVNTAVTQMDSVTQQNAALVEEASAASKSMENQAQTLIEQIAFFRTTHTSRTPVAAAAPRAVTSSKSNVRALPTRKSPARTTRATTQTTTQTTIKTSTRQATAAPAARGGDSAWKEF